MDPSVLAAIGPRLIEDLADGLWARGDEKSIAASPISGKMQNFVALPTVTLKTQVRMDFHQAAE